MKLWPMLVVPLLAVAAFSQQDFAPTLPRQHSETSSSGLIEISGGYSYDGIRNWTGPSVRVEYGPQDSNLGMNMQVARVMEFGDVGTVFKGGVTYDFSDSCYATGQLGSSSGGFFLPSLTSRFSLHQGWLSGQRLVAAVGMGYERWKDGSTDYFWPIGATYRLSRSWSAQAEISFELGKPNDTLAHMQYLAITQGREKKHEVTLAGQFGTEAFQVIGPQTTISNFHSYEITLKWRQWVRPNWGFSLEGLYYSNPEYQRKGIVLGLFREF
jgi:YaiO family outer membrane protein